MAIELLTIGTELLLGFTVDTNGAEIGRALAAAGVPVVRRTSVPDEATAIATAAREALARTGMVLATGGLGPTADDVTKKVFADLFGLPLEYHEEIWQGLLERFRRFGRTPSEKNRSQAEVPRGATVLPNRWGTAPGLWIEGPPGIAILLPGVPTEMRGLLTHEVLPRLAGRGGGRVIRSKLVRTTAIPEATLAEKLGPIEEQLAPLSLAYLPGSVGVDLRLTAWNLPADEAEAMLERGAQELRRRAGEWVYAEGETDLAQVLLERARAKGLAIATAESCTGGLAGARITAIPGSSDVYRGGVVAYDNAVKASALGVPDALMAEHGAVSAPVAEAMADGVAKRLGVPLAISVTGIAGPGGGTTEKPVGLVFIGVHREGATEVSRHIFPGNRQEVRERSAQMALFRLFRRLR
jgi:nicotinamide-nucleotide amidase